METAPYQVRGGWSINGLGRSMRRSSSYGLLSNTQILGRNNSRETQYLKWGPYTEEKQRMRFWEMRELKKRGHFEGSKDI